MRSSENVEELVRNAEMHSDPEANQAVLKDLLHQFDKTQEQESAVSQPKLGRTFMKNPITKLVAAAVVTIVAVLGIQQLIHSDKVDTEIVTMTTVTGPQTVKLADGSEATLVRDAQIRVSDAAGTRGFEYVAGRIDVSVTKGSGEFIVTTPYGNVKALGTEFTLDLVTGSIADTQEQVQFLAVEVTEGSVEVSNARGSSIIEESQRLVVETNQGPYNFVQDESLPARLRQRIGAMLKAMEAGDAAAYIANHNIDYAYKLVKGLEAYDSQRFGGSEADLQRIREGFGDVQSPEELKERFIKMVGIRKVAGEIYVRSVEISENGDHAVASCIERVSDRHAIGHIPQWHHFDGDWWQVDD